jgi:predicted nucleic acid-binding protein
MPDPLTISNTSPLLYLHLINRLELLKQMYGEVVIPPAVAQELSTGAAQGIPVPNPATITWLRLVPVQSPALIPAITDLGAGEAEVIGLALEHPGSRVIIDDQLGRRIAALQRLTVDRHSGRGLESQTGRVFGRHQAHYRRPAPGRFVVG